MHIVKSLFVLLALGILIWCTIISICRLITSCCAKNNIFRKSLKAVALCLVTLISVLLLRDYTYPFDRQVKLELVETVENKEEYARFAGTWFGVYGEYGMHRGSDTFHKNYIDQWITLDLKHYSYIASFGQPVESMSYNVWEKMHGPYQSAVHIGHVVLGKPSDSSVVYIYRIPRIRIDNDDL